MTNYIIFALVFLYTSYWVPINLFLSSLGKEKAPLSTIEDKNISKLLSQKTGLDIQTIKISESDKPFGMMIGIPTKPQLILSRNLYDTFSPNEIEYVVIHEAGHYKLWHGVIELIFGLLLFAFGIFLLVRIRIFSSQLPISLIMGIFFGILLIQLGKVHECQADAFTVKRMTNLQGMIQATNKFRSFHGKKYSENKNKIIQFLLYRANPYANRVEMANEEIKKRK